MNESTEVEGVQVTPIDANHCPGAAMLHFHDPATGATVLHVGDFRAASCLRSDPHLVSLLGKSTVTTLYLDTTYADPKHTFPDQVRSTDQRINSISSKQQRPHCLKNHLTTTTTAATAFISTATTTTTTTTTTTNTLIRRLSACRWVRL